MKASYLMQIADALKMDIKIEEKSYDTVGN